MSYQVAFVLGFVVILFAMVGCGPIDYVEGTVVDVEFIVTRGWGISERTVVTLDTGVTYVFQGMKQGIQKGQLYRIKLRNGKPVALELLN